MFVVGGMAAAALVAVSSSPALASAKNCSYDAVPIGECITIVGSGDNVISMTATATATQSLWTTFEDYTFHVQLVGPTGATICNSPGKNLVQGNTTSCLGLSDVNARVGQYCAIGWYYTPGSGYSEADSGSCASVLAS
jgi:hypothetical protein